MRTLEYLALVAIAAIGAAFLAMTAAESISASLNKSAELIQNAGRQ